MPVPAFIRRVSIVACVAVGLIGALNAPLWADRDTSRRPADHTSVQNLIERLGAREFAQREKAQDELRQLGVTAFEALHAARHHPDVEVRKQAEYLLHAIRISWVQPDDPPEVKLLLERYQSEDEEQRLERLVQLGQVADGQGLPALCRLARFETSEVLSKHAALAVMQYPAPESSPQVAQRSEQIRQLIGPSQRPAAEWLRVYARFLQRPDETLDDWQRLAAIEADEMRQRPDRSGIVVLQRLLRWQIEMLQSLGREAEMLAVLQQLIPLQGSSREELLQTIEWLLQRQAWSLVDDLVKAFPTLFQNDPFLLYRRAEVAQRQGKTDAAQALAAQALAMQAIDEPFLHVELGIDLQRRGLIDWAEREYQQTIETSPPGTHPPVEASIRLGWMCHDLARNHQAYEVFKQLVDLMEQDKAVVRRVQELDRVPIQVRGQMHFSHALDLADQQQWTEHRQELEEALKYDQENADILIAMHRVPEADDIWREKTARRIERLQEHYAQQVARAERDAETVPSSATNRSLAQALNQFAWLVSNTEGDLDAAVRSSQRSLTLIEENAGYLDTLARCYYAVGDYAAAVKHQRRAVELEPHTGQIRRQLEQFERVLKEQGPGTPYTVSP